jgi:hypothetical protein
MKKYIVIAITVLGLFSCKKNNTSPSNSNTSNSSWEKRSDLSIGSEAFSIGEILFCKNVNGEGMKSVDGGKTWVSCTKNLIKKFKNENLTGFLDTNFRGIFNDGTSLYVPVKYIMGLDPMTTQIFKSDDFGNSWTRALDNQPLVGVDKITFISNKIFVQNSYKISVSSDGGITWSNPNEFNKADFYNSSEKVVSDGINFYVIYNSILYKSTDSGISFLPVASDSLEGAQNIIAKNSELYCFFNEKYSNTSFNIYQSLNNGKTWVSTNVPTKENFSIFTPSYIGILPGYNLYTDNIKIYAGCKSECFVFDNTKTWKSLGKYSKEEASYTYSLIKHNGYLYAFTEKGVYRILE